MWSQQNCQVPRNVYAIAMRQKAMGTGTVSTAPGPSKRKKANCYPCCQRHFQFHFSRIVQLCNLKLPPRKRSWVEKGLHRLMVNNRDEWTKNFCFVSTQNFLGLLRDFVAKPEIWEILAGLVGREGAIGWRACDCGKARKYNIIQICKVKHEKLSK